MSWTTSSYWLTLLSYATFNYHIHIHDNSDCTWRQHQWKQTETMVALASLALRPVHTGTNIGARYSPVFFNAFFVFTPKRIFADDEPSEHANSFPDIRWRLM